MARRKRRRIAAAVSGIALLIATGAAGAQSPADPAPVSEVYSGPRHIPDDLLVRNAAALAAQASAPEWKRAATVPADWAYSLGEGVSTRQVSFYVDGGTRLQGKLFLPKDFDARASYPAVVVGHGINALAIGVEKYAAKFADRGLVAMAIDYQSYGFSDSGADELFLLEADATTDADPVTLRRMPVRIKRTNLNNVEEVKAFRAAISYLQGEPGVDPERIGVWATSNGGAVTSALIGVDGRVRAAVIHVMGTCLLYTSPSPRD